MNNNRHSNKTVGAFLQGLRATAHHKPASRIGANGAAAKAAAPSPNIKRCWLATPVAGFFAAAMFVNLSATAPAESWDDSRNGNPYVSAGYGDQCTAYAYGRYKFANGEALRFTNPQGNAVYPNAGLMSDYVVQTATSYRDTVPVRGSLISWTKPNEPGHTAIAERVNGSDGSCDISEQNWPTGFRPNNKTLTAANMQSRPSTVGGMTTYYSLRGFVNPNRPSSFGTLYTNNTASAVVAQFALLDEDRRSINLLSAIVDNGQIVPGTTLSGNLPSNNVVTANFRDTSQLRRGRTYTLYVWATDFRGLRSSKSVAFTW